MDGAGNLYSRVVTGLKILLPLGAIMLLSTMFLFARKPAEDPTIPYAEIEDIAREPRITDPYFAGISDDGSIIAIAADEVRPDAERADAFEIFRIRAEIDATDGSRIVLSAGHGSIDPRAQSAVLDGLVRISSSSGYIMESKGLTADLREGTIVTDGPVEAIAPFGQLTAGQVMVGPGSAGQGQQMVFQDGVRLVYERK
jgi:lipopolysaccharide export system protein LptC